MPTYTSQYPPAQSATYVKATTVVSGAAHLNTDPTKPLTGVASDNCWQTTTITNQRFHVDLGSGKVIRRIYYENFHHNGGDTNVGTENFTFWGSNTAGSFAELTYGTDTGWTELTVAQNTFDIHVGADQADPKYIVVTNTTAYRYYAFKFADNYGHGSVIGGRHIELQTEDGTPQLISTATIVVSTASTLSRGITELLISTANIASSITARLTRIMDLASTANIVTSITSRITKIIQIASTSAIATSITATLSRGITATLSSTSAITTSITSSLSRGITGVLTSTSNIATSITGSLSKGITQALTSTSAITTSIAGRLTRIVDLISASTITTSITGKLTRVIVLISTSVISTSMTAALSRGITQALTSVANIVLFITAKFPHWLKKPAPITTWTAEDIPTTTWTKEE